jgi:hypothetical protein
MAAAATSFFSEVFTRSGDPVRSRNRVARIARLLDSALVSPGTKIRFGLDPLIGLIPGAGDAVTTALSAYVVYEAYRAGLPPLLVLRMAINVVIDLIVGALPILGDIGDVFWRANQRNLKIFDDYLATRRGNGVIIEGSWRRLDR